MGIVEKFISMEYGAAPEDPREALLWLDGHGRRFGHFINGAWLNPASGQYFDTTDPSTGDKLASVAQGTLADINAAVEAARGALEAWQVLTPHGRARYLYALARQVQKHSRRLAVLETIDNGKPIRESRDIDIPLVAQPFYHHAGWGKLGVTGSTEVGGAIRKATAQSHKRLSLELGGKSPFIIFEDADLDSAVEGLVDGIWFNQGEVCCAGSRLLMQESIAEPLIAEIRYRVLTLRIGSPLDKAIDI